MRSTVVRDFKSYKAPESVNNGFIEKFLSGLDTPIALSVWLQYKYGEHDDLVKRDFDPSFYLETGYDHARRDMAAISLLKKSTFLSTSIDKRKVALESFRAAEDKCRDTNNRLRHALSDELLRQSEPVIHLAARKIERILGRFDVDSFLKECTWGPGVTQTVKGRDVSQATKFDVDCDITKDAHALFGPVLKAAFPNWLADREFRFRQGNVILTVPKNAKTDRTIAVEPGLNIWIQLGIGKLIRRRLRRSGFNLDSDLKNQRQAFLGSMTGAVATIDFKAASDTISRKVVELLLPPEWFVVLDAARSHWSRLDGSWFLNEKFSTMGCGFTFELESLIFVALALATSEILGEDMDCISIFGDDLTLSTGSVEEFSSVAKALGFTVNDQKSFASGCFRESCGAYYFRGIDVKPFFLKERISSVKQVYRAINATYAIAERHAYCIGLCDRFRRAVTSLVMSLPQKLRFYGPPSFGDAVIADYFGDGSYTKLRNGWEGFSFLALVEGPVCITKDSHGLLLARLFRGSSVDRKNDVELRSLTRTSLKKCTSPQLCKTLDWKSV